MRNFILNTFIDGKNNRKIFWLSLIGWDLIIILLILVIYLLRFIFDSTSLDHFTIELLQDHHTIAALIFLPILSIKRLNDLNQNRWLFLLGYIPWLNVILLIYCGFFPSAKTENKEY